MTNNLIFKVRGTAIVLVGLMVLASMCSGQQFTFSVPPTTPAIGVVKVTLEGAGAGKLTVSGSNPAINCGSCFTFNNGTAFGTADSPVNDTVNGGPAGNDLINMYSVLNSVTTQQDLVILYIRNGHFNTSGAGAPDYCSPKANAQQTETLTFNLTNATSSGYRINSYTVPGSQGVTAVDCSKAKRRVSAGAAFGTAPPGTNLGRHPLDVVLVLDKSGSMTTQDVQVGSTTTNITRMDALKAAAAEFIAHFSQADPDGTEGQDRLGLVFYSTNTVPANAASLNLVKRPTASTPTAWDDLNSTIQGTAADGNTAMGPGIQIAIDGWKAHANPDIDDATFVLMTDGLQNTGAQVTKCTGTQNQGLNPGCGPSSTCQPNGLAELYLCGIPMETLALSAGADHALVDAISQQTAGVTKLALTNTDLSNGFGDSLADLLKGNSESVLFHAEDNFTASGGGRQLRQTLLDGSVKRAIFVLGWQGLRTQNALDLQIFPPGCKPTACPPVAPVLRTDGPFWTVQSVDIPTSGPIGDWSVQVIRRQISPGVAAASAVGDISIPYHLSGYSIDGKLSYRITMAGVGQGTGDTINLQAQMSYDGKPLVGLGTAIKVHVDRPTIGEGTYLHNTSVPDGVLTTEPTPGDTTTPYERKLLYLASNGTLKDVIRPQSIPTDYTLRDNGSSQSRDLKADDGVYSGDIADTSRPGLYRFTVTLDWDTPTTGKIHRVEILERNVKVNPSPNASEVLVSRGTTPGSWLINVVPRDRFGNYSGPGFANSFDVQVTGGGSISGPPADANQTGAYALTVTGVPPGANPVVTIKVDGKPVRSAPLSKLQCQPNKKCCSPMSQASTVLLFAGVFSLGFASLGRKRKV